MSGSVKCQSAVFSTMPLTDEQWEELRRIVGPPSEPAGLVRRARVVLLSDAGVVTSPSVSSSTGCPLPAASASYCAQEERGSPCGSAHESDGGDVRPFRLRLRQQPRRPTSRQWTSPTPRGFIYAASIGARGRQMTEGTQHRFLVVDDDPTVQRALQRVVRRHGDVLAAGTCQEAAALLADRSAWTAFLFDVQLPDGSGLELLARARSSHPTTPAMVLTGNNEDAAANAAYDLRAHYVIKPVVSERIEHFLRDAVSLDARVAPALQEWAARYGLSEAETDLLGRTALGESKAVIIAARQTSKETIKTQVATLLGKTGDDSLQVAAARFLRDVARV